MSFIDAHSYMMCRIGHEGSKSAKIQLDAFRVFCDQIEKANSENKNVVIQGDANLCSEKWLEADFTLNYLSDELIGTLAQCGIKNVKLGNTYLADRLSNGGSQIESAIDHTYLTMQQLHCINQLVNCMNS